MGNTILDREVDGNLSRQVDRSQSIEYSNPLIKRWMLFYGFLMMMNIGLTSCTYQKPMQRITPKSNISTPQSQPSCEPFCQGDNIRLVVDPKNRDRDFFKRLEGKYPLNEVLPPERRPSSRPVLHKKHKR